MSDPSYWLSRDSRSFKERLTVHSDGLVPFLGRQLQLGGVELSPLATVVQVIPRPVLLAVAGVVEARCFWGGDQVDLQAESSKSRQPGG